MVGWGFRGTGVQLKEPSFIPICLLNIFRAYLETSQPLGSKSLVSSIYMFISLLIEKTGSQESHKKTNINAANFAWEE